MRTPLPLIIPALLLLAGCTAEADTAPFVPQTTGQIIRVIDGDTLEVSGETVRISNIDTAEMPPRSKCLAEQRLALAAKAGLEDVIGVSWGASVTLEREGTDQYRRTVARVRLADGTDVGEEMIRRGLAETWNGHRMDWCSEQ